MLQECHPAYRLLGENSVAIWIQCTRKTDGTLIYLNLDNAIWLRWNEEEGFTAVSWISGRSEHIVRVVETPEKIFKKVESLRNI
jgi:hypothetical protein